MTHSISPSWKFIRYIKIQKNFKSNSKDMCLALFNQDSQTDLIMELKGGIICHSKICHLGIRIYFELKALEE